MGNKIEKEIKTKLKNQKPTDFLLKDYCLHFSLPLNKLHEAIKILQQDKDLAFKVLTDITAIDLAKANQRFSLVYNLLSLKNNFRLIIKASINENENALSISDIFKASVWYEREIWDMFGIMFENSPDHRRILTDYGFTGHPLRKDFPLTGFNEVHYDEEQKKVVYAPVKLTQEFRVFDNISPWQKS
jgi:NADH-quinone oxidoreductase subunit C